MPNTKWEVNYPELGGVDQQHTFYPEGGHMVHPSGVKYVRRGGDWVIEGSEKDVENSK